ncbi:Cytochrome P450 [Mycena kentingensis (nom. inval.)]|nr:Cytochrome P450 [Mycena kentingensis (nom. inval.)]
MHKAYAPRPQVASPAPGPPGLPVVGNFFDLPTQEPWKAYQGWSSKYGSDVIHLQVFNTHMLLVNSAKAATDLFTKKSVIYSDRPRLPMIKEMIGLDWHFVYMNYGDEWRQHRKVFTQHASAFSPQKQLEWTKIFLRNLLVSPEDFVKHIQHLASGSSLDVSFGLQVQPSGQPDPFIGAAKQVVQLITDAGIFGTYIVDFLPFLKWAPSFGPFASWKTQARQWKAASETAAQVPWAVMKSAVESRDFTPSIASQLQIEAQDGTVDAQVARQAIAAMFASGSAATVSALTTFVLTMVLYPDVQKSAQEELDKVVGDLLPELSDEPNLPYITAIIREIGRWNPVAPLAFPHMLTTDDVYNGYHLKAGSVVLPNTWAILHDAEVYPSPDTFNPARFLTPEGKLDPLVKDPEAVWGYGRRVCPGRKIAVSEMFLAIAGTLKVFNISVGEGNPRPGGEYGSGMLRYPKPFKCAIVPRSKAAVGLLE